MKTVALLFCMLLAASASAAAPDTLPKKTATAKKAPAHKPPFKTAPKRGAQKPARQKPAQQKAVTQKMVIEVAEPSIAEPASEPTLAASEPAPVAPDIVPSISPEWDMFAGGTPDKGHGIFQVEAGFTALPAVAYHCAVAPRFTVGVRAAFDDGFDQLDLVFVPSVLVQVPLRLSLRRERLSIGLRFDPGGGVTFAQVESFGQVIANYSIIKILVPLSVALEYHFGRIAMGVGASASMRVAIPTTGTAITEQFPVLAGPLFEGALSDNLRLTVDAEAGVLIPTSGDLLFVFHAVAGVAVRL